MYGARVAKCGAVQSQVGAVWRGVVWRGVVWRVAAGRRYRRKRLSTSNSTKGASRDASRPRSRVSLCASTFTHFATVPVAMVPAF